MPLLEVQGLVKIYPGGVEALRGVSFSLEEGEVFGLVGPNGSGKTTLLRIVATLLKPTRGRVVLDGVDAVREPGEARRRLAYVPEEVGGYRRLTGLEYLSFVVGAFLSARGASMREVEEALEEAVRLTGLSRRQLGRRMQEYSKGMKRRLQVAWALAVKPRLAILDEPTSGLDMEAGYELRRVIAGYARSHGVTVLMSSHNLFEVEYLCDRVAFMKNGRVIDMGSPRELIARYGARNLEEAYMSAVAERGAA
ncbi:multidrug ABC transporter ATP-binding protein [Pyrodictium occultum]|uniref:Multidrug ABC transporter ATP-binding protein n=1 Tax=Pyrodictium occultum TaxID=2309 RepID=A0A0V8RWN2_PYROC|nr:ABC transporter ATP-binding protein [Pyrodictium occultum]KSW12489.1 multidrug ABC transporter ATP-binding protein [Pyrodictium occultum]